MCRLIARLLSICCVAVLGISSLRAGDLIPPHIASQLGMTEAWKRYIQVPAGAQSIVDQQIFVHQQHPREYVEISVPADPDAAPAGDGSETPMRVLLRIPTDRMGVDGVEIGKQEAERLANNELRRLKRKGYDAVISSREVPRIHLYTLSRDGTIECRDAESGEPIWISRVGKFGLNYGALGVSEDHLSVINGPRLLQIDISDGTTIEEINTQGSPIHGAVHAGRFSLVPTITNGVEGYPMYDPTLDPFMEIVNGIALSLPTKAPDLDTTRIAWGTSKGFVYAMELSGEPSILFRLDTDGIVSGRLASATGNRFFFGSEAGQVYAIRATRTGRVLWSQPFGEPFYNGPMVVGDRVLIRSAYGNLFCLRTEDGSTVWDQPAPNVDEVLGTVGDSIFIRTLSGSLAVVDLVAGSRTMTFGEIHPGRLLRNSATDRLYMVADSGAVQCLRPINAVMPTFRVQPDVADEEPERPAAPGQQPGTSPFNQPGGADPFGDGAADPFGAGGAGADPFGAGGGNADPFGGGDNMNDPFGADPFGNN